MSGEMETEGAKLVRPTKRRYWLRRGLAGLYGAFFGVVVIYDPSEGFMPPESWQDGVIGFGVFVSALAMIGYAIGFRPRRGVRFWQLLPWAMLATWVYSGYHETLVAPGTHDDVALALVVLTGSIALYPFIHLLFRFRAVGRLPEVDNAQPPRGWKRWLGLRAERDVWSGAVSHPRWFQFGIAGPALLVTLWCVWLGLKVEQLRAQREAVVRLDGNHARLEMHKLSDLENRVKEYLPKNLLVDVESVIFREDAGGDQVIPDVLKCRSVEVVKFPYDNDAFTDRAVQSLGTLPKLRKLSTETIEVTDETLVALSRQKALEELSVFSNRVTDVGVRAIATCPLVLLDIESTHVSDEGIEALGACETLYSLWVIEAGMTDRGLAAIVKLPKLTSLKLSNVDIDGSGFASIGDHPQLSFLFLAETGLNDQGIATLSRIPSLETVSIFKAPLTDASAEHFRRFFKVREIYLRNVPLSDQVLVALYSIQSLRTLTMARTRVTGEAVWQLPQFPQILQLDLNGSPVTNSGFAAIVNKLSAPCELDVNDTQITDAAFRLCKPTSHLNYLSCDKTWITDEAIFECRKFEGLQSLSFEWTLVSRRAINALQNLRSIEDVFAEGTALDALSEEELDDLLPNV